MNEATKVQSIRFDVETLGPEFVVTAGEGRHLTMLGAVEALERLGIREERAVGILTAAIRSGQARGQW